jgi:hypothetical protein
MDDTRLLQQLADRAGVIDTVLRAARAMDVQDWPALRACLAATLDVDYSDLRGDPRPPSPPTPTSRRGSRAWPGSRPSTSAPITSSRSRAIAPSVHRASSSTV